ncbi:MAG: AAA family ATPase [Candidatus Hydrothermia bacterium]|jgi:predicted ATPase
MLKKLKLKNFKSFKDVEIELGNLNVLIGPNAGGKTNFINVFRFLRSLESEGLNNAISLHGGFYSIRNFKAGVNEPILIEMEFFIENLKNKYKDFEYGYEEEIPQRIRIELSGNVCFSLQINENNENLEKSISFTFKNSVIKKFNILERQIESSWNTDITIYDDLNVKFRPSLPYNQIKPDFLSLQVLKFFGELNNSVFQRFFTEYIGIYDFEAKLIKETASFVSSYDLEEDGSNIAFVIENILSDKSKRKTLLNLISYVLDFIEGISTERSTFKDFVFLKVKEKFSNDYIPSYLLSDGTIRIIALIVALYFENKNILIFEEPEINIHPSLLSIVIDLFKESSNEKQILITTHNPEFLKYIDLDDIIVISRNKDGFSVIKRLNEIEDIKFFLKNEIGVDELFVENLLK